MTTLATRSTSLSWLSIVRMGLVQTALGAVVVLTTSTINRVMVVELALPAVLPGALVALHYALQVLRPRWGHGSDVGGVRTPWIIGGMAVLGLGGIGAAFATTVMPHAFAAGVMLAIASFTLVGVGVGATGTSLLAMLATHVAPERRAAAATIVWLMMIVGFIVTTIVAGSFLDPYSPTRLVAVTAAVSAIAFLVATVAIYGVESSVKPATASERPAAPERVPFWQSLREVWHEPAARRFAIFIFVSMLAYSMQDLILEPFAGLVFGMTPGQSTKLSGMQHSGVFCGMLLVALAASPRIGLGSLRGWTVAGCASSALALLAVVAAGYAGDVPALKAAVFALGFANGAYAVAAIGSMMALAASGREKREGMRMGIFGAAQAVSFGAGGFFGTIAVDVLRGVTGVALPAYATVFCLEAALFIVAAALAVRATQSQPKTAHGAATHVHDLADGLSGVAVAAARR
ncbi:MAG: BCD family MFS transporter [Hyphomicrobium sp.]